MVMGPGSMASLGSAVLEGHGVGHGARCPRGHEALLGIEWGDVSLLCWACQRSLSRSKGKVRCASCGALTDLDGLSRGFESVVSRAVDAMPSSKPASEVGRYVDWGDELLKLAHALEGHPGRTASAPREPHVLTEPPRKPTLPALKEIYDNPAHVEGRVRYQLVGLLGVGGFARVHLAHVPNGRFAVVKEAWGYRTDDEKGTDLRVNPYSLAARKLRLEGEYLKDVAGQAHLPQYIEHFEYAGGTYLVMEFIHGPNLREYVYTQAPSDRGLEVAEALRIFRAAAETVQVIHDGERVHRDLTPRNMLMRAGNPILIDFGTIAKDTGLTAHVQTGISAGGYHPPEQARGVASKLCDVFSLGSCLYFLLTGKDPPEAKQAGASEALLRDEMTRQGVPSVLQDVVRRSRAWEPSGRFSEVDEILRAIHLYEHPEFRACVRCRSLVRQGLRVCESCGLRYCTGCGAAVGYEPSCSECGRAICPWCNTATRRGLPNCQGCGSDLRVRACSKCHSRVPARSSFCRRCGAAAA